MPYCPSLDTDVGAPGWKASKLLQEEISGTVFG
jgi:hypothetical protein